MKKDGSPVSILDYIKMWLAAWLGVPADLPND